MNEAYIPNALRQRVAAQARHRCGYCLTSETIVGTPMEIDHIIPQSLGGPEDAQRLLDPAIHHMMDAVHRYEGTVNQVLGDGIMALFGAPIAHEEHALQACCAALAMQAALRDYAEAMHRTHGLEVRIRVGLHSGEVVVRTIGNDLHMDYSALRRL